MAFGKASTAESAHFRAARTEENHWEIRRRTASGQPGEVIGSISYTAPDEFRCMDAEIDIDDTLTAEEYSELLQKLNDCVSVDENAVFIRVSADVAAAVPQLWDALEQMKCTVDSLDNSKLIWEYTVPNTAPLYLCLGLCVGMCIGMAIGAARGNMGTGMNLGMCAGMASGLGIGSMFVQSRRKKIDELRDARTKSAEQEKTEE